MYKLYADGRLVHDNVPSTGSASVAGFYSENDFYIMGYSGGADNFSNAAQYSNYETVIQTPLYKVGNKIQKASYSEMEVQMAKISTSGAFRIKYRADELSTFSNFPGSTVDQSADSASTSWSFDVGLTDLENIQFQIEMHGIFELLEIRLYP